MHPDYLKFFGGFFDHAADAAGEIARRYFRTNIAVEDKTDHSPVTQADREIEKKLRDMIAKSFPTHGIIGEEFGRENDDAEFVWVLDPIDGTKSFITGRPLFGTIIGLMHKGKPVMGVIEQAFTRERWVGVTDTFATHNGKSIKVAAPRILEEARLATGMLSMFQGKNFEKFLKLCDSVKLAQQGCDCYVYGLLAMGCIDVLVEQKLSLYDVAGSIPIITGAGGFIGDWQGQPISMDFGGHCIAASTKALAMQAARIMTGS